MPTRGKGVNVPYLRVGSQKCLINKKLQVAYTHVH